MKAKQSKKSGEVVLEVKRRDETLLKASALAPFRIRNILVPIDFSDCSKKALEYAVPFALQHGATITLIHLIPAPLHAAGERAGADFASLEREMIANAELELDDLALDKVRDTVPVDCLVRCGSPANNVIETAKNMPADLIVIATHGRTGWKHALLGSVAEHVVRHAPCPVLVVREQEHEFVSG